MITTPAIISAIDHIVIATPNLEATCAEFQSLGFQMTPRGVHERFGTANYLCIFEDSYVELLGIDGENPVDMSSHAILKPTLAQGGGVPMVAVTSEDPQASYDALVWEGFHMGELKNWSRPADTPDGQLEAHFTTFFVEQELLPDLTSFFCVQHTPQYVRHPAWQVHDNGCNGFIGLAVETQRDLCEMEVQAQLISSHIDPMPDQLALHLGPHKIIYTAGETGKKTILLKKPPSCSSRCFTLQTVANTSLDFIEPQ